MTQDALEKWIKQLIAEDKLYKFYKCREWRQLSEAVMKENNRQPAASTMSSGCGGIRGWHCRGRMYITA